MKAMWFAVPDVFLVDPWVFGSNRWFFNGFHKTIDDYTPEYERCTASSDPSNAIAWPTEGELVLSAKNARAKAFD